MLPCLETAPTQGRRAAPRIAAVRFLCSLESMGAIRCAALPAAGPWKFAEPHASVLNFDASEVGNLFGGVCLDVHVVFWDVSIGFYKTQNLFYPSAAARARLRQAEHPPQSVIKEPFKQNRRAGPCAVRFGPVISFFKLPIGSS